MSDTKEAKRYLKAIRAEQKELRILIDQMRTLRWSLLPSALTYDKEKVRVSPSDVFSEKMIEAAELTRAIETYINKLEIHKAEAVRVISEISQPNYRMVLMLYYIGESERIYRWADVAKAMNYSIENVQKLHGRALYEFAKIFKKI